MASNDTLLNVFDNQLLTLLQEDSQLKIKFLAETLKSSRRKVAQRILQLEQSSIIQFYPIIINWSKLGFNLPGFFLLNVKPKGVDDFITSIKNHPNVASISESFCNYNLRVMVRLENMESLQRFTLQYLASNENVHNYSYSAILRHYYRGHLIETISEKRSRQIPLLRSKPESPRLMKIDEIDLGLIDLLLMNARKPLQQMARQLGVAPQTISYRIKKLEMFNIIRLFTVDINYERLGLYNSQILLKTAPNKVGKLLLKLSPLSEVLWMNVLSGTHNISMDIITHGRIHLDEFVETHLNSVDYIKELDICLQRPRHKKYYL